MAAVVELNDPTARAAVLEREKHVLRIKNEARREVSTEKQGPVPDLLSLSLAELAAYPFPARRPLLYRGESVVFREGHIGEIYAERGFGKSWLLQTIALVTAFGIDALGVRNPTPCRVPAARLHSWGAAKTWGVSKTTLSKMDQHRTGRVPSCLILAP